MTTTRAQLFSVMVAVSAATAILPDTLKFNISPAAANKPIDNASLAQLEQKKKNQNLDGGDLPHSHMMRASKFEADGVSGSPEFNKLKNNSFFQADEGVVLLDIPDPAL